MIKGVSHCPARGEGIPPSYLAGVFCSVWEVLPEQDLDRTGGYPLRLVKGHCWKTPVKTLPSSSFGCER